MASDKRPLANWIIAASLLLIVCLLGFIAVVVHDMNTPDPPTREERLEAMRKRVIEQAEEAGRRAVERQRFERLLNRD